LPIADDRLEIGLEQAVWNLTDAGGVSNLQASLVGLRFVLWPDAPIVPHVRLAGGLLYGLNAGGLQSPTPAILAGLGASWPITPNVGLSLEVTGGYPIAWRPSLGLWFAL
jgi:hypothetical protein